MKNIISLIIIAVVAILIYSCTPAGTTKNSASDDEQYVPFIHGEDTIDFYTFFYAEGRPAIIGIERNGKNVMNLNYQYGETQQNVIILNSQEDIFSSSNIRGNIIFENDDIILLRKKDF